MKLKLVAAVALAAVLLVGCGSSKAESSKYLTKLDWAALSNLKCAVERDDYDGDVIAAGTYKITSHGTPKDGSETVSVYDIYVSDNEYERSAELKESEYVTSVGGDSNEGGEVTVSAGQYLYINYFEVVGTPIGYINLTLE